MSNTSMPANFLNRTALPSITGLPASGPILPRPSTAVPFETTATRLARAVSSAACGRIGDDRLAGGRDARRIGERQVALVAERLGRLDLQLSGPRRAVVDQRAGAQIVGNRRSHCHTPVQSGATIWHLSPRQSRSRLMVKVLVGLLAAIVIAVAAFFGFEFYVQQQVANEVEAAFAAVRASGAKASHGTVSFDLWSRTITVADIAGESAAQPPVSVKIGRFTADGVKQPDAGRFSADRIEAADVEVAGTMPVQAAAALHLQGAAHRGHELQRAGRPAAPARSGRTRRRVPLRARAFRRRHGGLDHGADRRPAASRSPGAAGARRLHLFGPRAARHPRRPDRHDRRSTA